MPSTSKRIQMARALLVLAALTATACGSEDAVVVVPTPGPPPIATRAYVHVLSPPRGTTRNEEAERSSFEVTPGSGHLRTLAVDRWRNVRVIAADPRGRLVYLGGFLESRGGSLRSYSFDAASGALQQVGQAVLSEPQGSFPSWYIPTDLQAAEGTVGIIRNDYAMTHLFTVDASGGTFTPAGVLDVYPQPTWLVLPSGRNFAFIDRGQYGVVSLRLGDRGPVELSRATTPGDRGVAFAGAYANGCFVATWRTGVTSAGATGGGITSYVVDAGTAYLTRKTTVEGFVPLFVAAGAAGHVAVTSPAQLLTFSLTQACELVRGATDALSLPTKPDGTSGSLAFHPSGNFVYVDAEDGLRNYRLGGPEQLTLLETVTGVRGHVVAADAAQ